MATYSATAFKWTGTYYNATYDDSHQVTFTDDDPSLAGWKDGDERVSIDGGPETATTGPAYAIEVSFTDTEGHHHVETFHFFHTDDGWYFVPGPDSAFTEGATLGTYQSHTTGWDYADVVCFADGTLIDTADGPVPVENLQPGTPVRALDGGLRPLRLNLRRRLAALQLRLQPRLRPVRIARGTLGHGLPDRDLLVSRQHRMLVASPIARRMFGTPEVLIPAIRLTGWPGCRIDAPRGGIAYHHLVFDRHEVIFANGAPSESFLPGPQAMKTIPEAAVQEVLTLFPALRDAPLSCAPARHIPAAALQKRLLARHLKNGKPLIVAHPETAATA